MQDDPLVSPELAERYVLAAMAPEGEVRGIGADFDHEILPCSPCKAYRESAPGGHGAGLTRVQNAGKTASANLRA